VSGSRCAARTPASRRSSSSRPSRGHSPNVPRPDPVGGRPPGRGIWVLGPAAAGPGLRPGARSPAARADAPPSGRVEPGVAGRPDRCPDRFRCLLSTNLRKRRQRG
jgi:hypothetical protein